MITKEFIENFARALRRHQDPAYGNKAVGGIDVLVVVNKETDAGYEDFINVSDLTREDIKAIGDWMGETVYLNAIDGCGICINPDEDEVECGLWEEI